MDWTDESWRAYRNYADQVVIQIKFLDETDQVTELDSSWVILTLGANWDQDWLLQQVEAIGDNRFYLQTRENRLSWGAEAASLQVILSVGEIAMTAALGAAIDRLATMLSHRLSEGDAGEPLAEDEATERARWIIAKRYELDGESLIALSVEVEPPHAARVSLRGDNGETYDVELRREHGLVYVAKVKRSLPPGSPDG